MSILKLEVGSPITLTPTAVREVEGKFGMQLAFDTAEGDTLFLGIEAADRQLDRIGYNRTSVVGKPLVFEKVDKGGKKFTNINPAPSGAKGTGGAASAAKSGNGHPATHTAPGTTQPAPRQAVKDALDLEEVEFSDSLYLAITDFVLANVAPRYASAGIKPIGDGAANAVASMVATLYIQAKRG